MERIHVTVRARPLSAEDAKSSPWRISANSIFIPNHSSKFEFDRIFSQDCKTMEVYESRTKEIVGAAVRGFNGTVFAYGQTNSGKTYTMRGSASEPGVIPLAVRDLFATIDQDVDREFLLRMSYMEIYNEEINDLLAPEHRKLQIHESIERGIYVAGLREEIVSSPEQVLGFMEFGESHRHIGVTNMNLHSSRSHTIFRMIIESRDRTEDGDIGSSCDAVRVSVLNLVDLAGSERVAKTGAEGVRLKEGSHINKSLMTLGTVIKKLSEGVESQGGHVPYRDSKLTRILQPALGGNANTGIICNITLAQIHADETKSSLQFASRALRVKNCAHVNEILTDAALLKRQKKEIEELRAKLQGSHSEHMGDEIFNLRNTLLQTELERERIALELEEERKAQAEREKMVQEQAKTIQNLSSMVLCSNRDENRERLRKDKRRDTWCASNLSREVHSMTETKDSGVKPIRSKLEMAPLIPFEELMNPITEEDEESCKQDDDCGSNTSEDYTLPDPSALLDITNRRKLPPRKKSFPNVCITNRQKLPPQEKTFPNDNKKVADTDVADIQAEYEDLLLRFENQRTESEIQIDYLTRRLAEVGSLSCGDKDFSKCCEHGCTINGDGIADSKYSEAIVVIKRLQEQIKMLEMEKASSQQNLASMAEIATEQNMCAQEKFEQLHGELLDAREEARVANEQLISCESEENSAVMNKLVIEVQDVILEVHESKQVINEMSSLLDDVSKTFPSLFDTILDFKALMRESSLQEQSIISNHEKLNKYLMKKVSELENEKCLLYGQSVDLQNQIEELKLEAQNSEQAFRALLEEQDQEKEEYISHIQILEKELSSISSCSLAKEKEILRKDLEKTKTKLKDIEFKLKNIMQEKTTLEGQKAFAEREIKRLHGQISVLERDINRRESLAGRRRDSVFDKNLKTRDPKKSKGFFDESMQEEYKKMEVHVFEMETKIASLEEELSATFSEKEEMLSRHEDLASQLEALSEKLNASNAQINILHEEATSLRQMLEDSTSVKQQLESSLNLLLEEKEELSMQLSDSLLEMEEEKAVWSAKERASIEAIGEKTRLYASEVASLSKELSEVRSELESCTQECEMLRERLARSEEDMGKEKSRMESDNFEIKQYQEKVDVLQDDLVVLRKERDDLLIQIRDLQTRPDLSKDLQCLRNELLNMTEERDKLEKETQEQQSRAVELEFVNKRSNDMLIQAKVQVEELTKKISDMEVKMHKDRIDNNKEMTKFQMRLRWTQAKLDAFRVRYRQMVEETDLMNEKYKEAAGKLKERLASKGIEVLNLKKLLAVKDQHH